MNVYKKKSLPYLHDWMLQKQATNYALAAKAGVSHGTVARLRKGVGVQPHIADYIVQALQQNDFGYGKKGRPKCE